MNNNYKINEYLGAKIFKKLVFKLENIKFKISLKFFPNLYSYYEYKLKRQLDKNLLKEDNEEKRQLLIKNYQNDVLLVRKENNQRKNRNYHIKMNNPNEFVKYLNSNKKIHINGLIRNGISYLIIALFIICGIELLSTIGYIALIINTFSTIINFECVNLQNYNLKRFELSKDKYEKVRLKKEESDIKKYGKISEVVSQEFSKTNDIPNIEDIVSNITTKEQLEQMRNLLLSNSNQKQVKEKKKVLNKGGL